MSIHREHPFVPPPEEREPVRRFRGRLAAPVTVLTAGVGEGRAGLTVSSLVVVEGEVGRVAAVVGDLTDLWEAVTATSRFVVHVLDETRRDVAELFAGLRPAPGGPFSEQQVEETEWGPRLVELSDWVGCRVERADQLGYQRLLIGTMEHLSLSDLRHPLVHFRGTYQGLR